MHRPGPPQAVRLERRVVCRLGDDMDIVICPGCGEDVPHDNNGCPHCGYENGWNGADGRLMTLRELLAAPSYPEIGAMEMNNVCPAFLRRLAEEAVKAHNAMLRGDVPRHKT